MHFPRMKFLILCLQGAKRGEMGVFTRTGEEGEKGNEGGNYFIHLLRCWRESRCGKLLARGGITPSRCGKVLARGGITPSVLGLVCC